MIQSKDGTLSTVLLEMIARQYLKEHQITVESGEPIIDIYVCDTNRMAAVKFWKGENLIEWVEIGPNRTVTRVSEVKMATEE